MGFWSTLLSIGGDIAGSFVGDPMLGNQIAGAANAVGSALNSKDAAKAATNTLTGAANQASAQLAPFAQGGNEAFKKQLAMYGIQLPANSAPMQAPPVNPVAAAGGGPYGMSSTPPQQGAVQMPQGYSLGSLIPSPTAQTIQNGPGGSSYRPGRI